MPALVLFHRKWLIACDDLVIPFAIEAFIRFIWLNATLFTTWLTTTGCDQKAITQYFMYSLDVDLLTGFCLSFIISLISSRGSVLEVQKRAIISKLLYLKCGIFLLDLTLASLSIWILQEIPVCPDQRIFIQAAVFCLWIYILIVLLSIVVCYNSLGSVKYFKNDNYASKFFKKAEWIWKLRLKLFCCCADISEEENEYIYVEISSFLAGFSKDIDLAPTDILAGLVTLNRKHAIWRRKPSSLQVPYIHLFNHESSKPSWMTAENALYFLKVAKSTYGWLTFFNTFQPWKLCSLIPLTTHCRNICQDSSSISHDDCCLCNTSAVQKITGYTETDILYSTFANSVYEPAFVIVKDNEKQSIIIAIRGTRSFSDLITDIDGETMNVQDEGFSMSLKCHRGVLRSALFMQKKINDLNILKVATAENPSYTLVITGHSLGASIAAMLALLLHSEYPNLQCYAFAPLAFLSLGGIQNSLNYIFTVVVGDDLVPRLCTNSCKRLVKELIDSLGETEYPKYKILTKAFWHHFKRYFKKRKMKAPLSLTYDNHPTEIDVEIPKEQTLDIISDDQLYAPGRILYLYKTEKGCQFTWMMGYNLHSIVISPHLFKDHQPHQIHNHLEMYKILEENKPW